MSNTQTVLVKSDDPAVFSAICASLMHSVETWAGVDMSLDDILKKSEADAKDGMQVDLPPDDAEFLVKLLALTLGSDLKVDAGGFTMPAASPDVLKVVLPAIKSVMTDRKVGMLQRRAMHVKELIMQRKKRSKEAIVKAQEMEESPSAFSKTSIRTRVFNVLRATPGKAEAGPTRSALARATSRVGRCCWCAAILRCVVLDDERGALSMLAMLNDVIVDDHKSTKNEDNVVAYGPAATLQLAGQHIAMVNRCLANRDADFTDALERSALRDCLNGLPTVAITQPCARVRWQVR